MTGESSSPPRSLPSLGAVSAIDEGSSSDGSFGFGFEGGRRRGADEWILLRRELVRVLLLREGQT